MAKVASLPGRHHLGIQTWDLVSHSCYPNPTRTLVGNEAGVRFIPSAFHCKIQT